MRLPIQMNARQVGPTHHVQFDFASLANPILLVNDAPDLTGGLSRIGRDLASLICMMPEFRVGYLGRGGIGRRAYPWTQYNYPATAQWGESHLENVWEDFSGGKPGIIMSLWDVSRMLWFSNPKVPELQRFLGDGRNFLKWGYFPVDGHGPNGRSYGVEMSAALQGYDRTLAASEFGAEVLRTSHANDPDWIPHGYWPDKFCPSPIPAPHKGSPMVGCVMANQARKDWGTAFKVAALCLAQYGNKFLFWVHTDRTTDGYWNIHALAYDHGMQNNMVVTQLLDDHVMRQYYTQCDVTILPSGGEGFGYPIVESMACGTPCIVPDYAAGQEIVNDDCKVLPNEYRIDTQYNIVRAVLNSWSYFDVVSRQINKVHSDPDGTATEVKSRIEHLQWPRIEHVWRRWLLKGIGQ